MFIHQPGGTLQPDGLAEVETRTGGGTDELSRRGVLTCGRSNPGVGENQSDDQMGLSENRVYSQ